jgi:acetolactate synthase-1/3 small subunit
MEQRHIISVLVDNYSGVLQRVTGLFSRRGYNIESLSVGATANPKQSRITIVVNGDDYILDQIKKQLNKLIVVKKVLELKPKTSIFRELILVKVKAKPEERLLIFEMVNIFRAKVVDLASESLTIEITGEGTKNEAFIELLEPYGIIELARTGITALERGNTGINNHQKYEN